jgi:hypothetical protein
MWYFWLIRSKSTKEETILATFQRRRVSVQHNKQSILDSESRKDAYRVTKWFNKLNLCKIPNQFVPAAFIERHTNLPVTMSVGRDERCEQCGVRRRRAVVIEDNSKVLLEDVRQALMKKVRNLLL